MCNVCWLFTIESLNEFGINIYTVYVRHVLEATQSFLFKYIVTSLLLGCARLDNVTVLKIV